MEFSVGVRQHGRHTVVTVSGEVDLSTATAFRDVSLEAMDSADGDLIVDLADVTFIDSTGLSALVLVRREIDSRERRMALVATRKAQAILKISGLESSFELHPNLASALGHYGDSA